jgi:uncharacterized membrane protein
LVCCIALLLVALLLIVVGRRFVSHDLADAKVTSGRGVITQNAVT